MSLWFNPPLALAPLEGIGGPALLGALARVGGMGLLAQPFLRVVSPPERRGTPSTHPLFNAALADRLCARHGAMCHSVQLLGNDPARMAEAARRVVPRGVEVIDLNFGCPSRMVTRKDAGAALLKDPARIGSIVRAVRDAVPVRVTAKVRLGIADHGDVLAIARAVADAGADALTVHARTLAEAYRPPAHWEWIRQTVESVSIPVIGNGDVWTAEDALRMRAETGAAGVMIGRGALRNPWIFRQIEQLTGGQPVTWPTIGDLYGFLTDVMRALEDEVATPAALPGRVKEVVSHLGTSLDDRGVFRHKVLRARSLTEIRDHVAGLIESPPNIGGAGSRS